MSIEIRVPTLPESVADATLISWHKAVGDFIQKDENLVDLETDKVVLEVPAPESGILTEIISQDGSTVTSGDLLAIFTVQASPSTNSTEKSPPTQQEPTHVNAEIPLSPAVRRIIFENNLDPSLIKGTGKGGRITKADVQDYLANNTQESTPSVTVDMPKAVITQPAVSTKEEGRAVSNNSPRPEQRVPMTRLRAKVAERLLQAQQNAAMLTTFNEVNMQNVIDLRKQYQDRFTAKHNVKLGFMSFFIKASIEALKHFPAINASIDGEDIIYHGYYDVGIAVASPRGLIVPVLRDADQLDFAGIEKNIVDFSTKAKAGTLTYDELNGGTFTITNGGIFGSMLSTPILNPPQCAILGMHAITERAVVEKGEIVIRPIMYLALSYDHRLVDGRDAVQFLVAIKEGLESPAHLLLNI
ncbi:2-oxoglutarate dehydrogenase complex dihydrolipoyllysine-residue succinyltransferase [methanotrophic endosymbiont of Bathymodiolus puteoserpentis (Logatchev)]|jgi:2-oxoglutarate dehydrogenase E2 component (dihydrolipoamide succinyltransferase)|uniref:2-oxoglutarate dehydrogenase complex dihydrolipoyllysine-residue succinyltransferase n=1 Tax=methanotrophic endosymbiont of Bathymodiolus puteoserpentis (Logatchev) TaxID=343235 RepID=UPI0013CDB877|nr:2-oxoglutarate dehydrogenase complex dihydrolipoyllysine-residue succinyltransferase [methanotrophic endosymbiont of Bathymodiolus puteoserpentis (Logatchev)]SHE23726.1 Dihydrolipoamide succinyltransferase component (E2) of 2-oxoglutarate dehydrogenase complex [methanotrophic endosymbiont of Bathymodiolus puteoserpentis (Logatchev)]